jgi:uncharacterized protein (TIGR03083 family)
MYTVDPALIREAFAEASATFSRTVGAVPAGMWDRPSGCGTWTVRELVAHTLRAFSTIGTYLDAAPTSDVLITDAVDYYRTVLVDPGVHAGVAARGREAAASLADPAGDVEIAAQTIGGRVASTGDDEQVNTRFAQIPFIHYLATRVIELALHTADLQRAIGSPVDMHPVVAEAVLDVLVRLGSPTTVALALSGRGSLPADYNVLG